MVRRLERKEYCHESTGSVPDHCSTFARFFAFALLLTRVIRHRILGDVNITDVVGDPKFPS